MRRARKPRLSFRELEGAAKYEEFQQFLATTALVAREGRLGRYAYFGGRPPR